MRTTLLLAALTLLPAVAFAQAADLLFSARTLTCEWGQGTSAKWTDGGPPSLSQGSFGAGTIFDAIDTEAGTARIIGNAGSGDVNVVVTPVGLTFIAFLLVPRLDTIRTAFPGDHPGRTP